MTLGLIITLILFGLLLFVVEVFLIPGTTFVGIVGLLLVAAGVYFSYQEYGSMTGGIVLVVSLVVSGTLTYIGLKRLSQGPFTVKEAIDGRVNLPDFEGIEAGDEGKALTDLRPEGKALIRDQRVTVYSRGEFIDSGTDITVFRIEHNKIFVKEKT